ncbi:hypothetical protein MM213_09505 [Belliella sp. R4-6]|uniref:HTH-type transcriptional regulator / antitoxin HigA n=1 Tax=Belliella alkalica TaxID=1730871 RepID=A0ABS9VBB8_9BACT|nr:hypothetical protein [Belliella alkalica]MCH7413721.1 hypothetical protein [Belliella alkalica]
MIKSEKEYNALIVRIEELLSNPVNIENTDSKNYIELNLLSDMVADFKEKYFSIQTPTLSEAIRLRMQEW